MWVGSRLKIASETTQNGHSGVNREQPVPPLPHRLVSAGCVERLSRFRGWWNSYLAPTFTGLAPHHMFWSKQWKQFLLSSFSFCSSEAVGIGGIAAGDNDGLYFIVDRLRVFKWSHLTPHRQPRRIAVRAGRWWRRKTHLGGSTGPGRGCRALELAIRHQATGQAFAWPAPFAEEAPVNALQRDVGYLI